MDDHHLADLDRRMGPSSTRDPSGSRLVQDRAERQRTMQAIDQAARRVRSDAQAIALDARRSRAAAAAAGTAAKHRLLAHREALSQAVLATVAARSSSRPQRLMSACPGLLEQARKMIGCSTMDLWLEYFGVTGELGFESFCAVMAGSEGMRVHDHDLVVLVLNERFSDLGLGQPLDQWRSPDQRWSFRA